MDIRKLGQTGVSTPPLALGGNVFGWTADRDTSFALLDGFVDEGFGLIDTAEVYSAWAPGHRGGESETVIGEWLASRKRRNHVQIATKVGMPVPGAAEGLGRRRILEAAEGSLRRLKTDHIDVYFSHKDDADTPLEETLRAYEELIRSGKVRAIGASNYAAGRVEKANRLAADQGLPRYEVLQPEYNLLERQFEQDLAPLAEREGLGVMTYFALAAGFLTGKYRKPEDVQGARARSVGKYVDERGLKVVHALDEVAHAHGVSDAQVALAWVMSRPGVTAAIASATSLDQLRDLTAAARLELSDAQVARLDAASAPETAPDAAP